MADEVCIENEMKMQSVQYMKICPVCVFHAFFIYQILPSQFGCQQQRPGIDINVWGDSHLRQLQAYVLEKNLRTPKRQC